MSKRKFFNTIKRRVLPTLPKLKGQISVKKVSWGDSFWAKQLQGIERLGEGLVVMRMG